MQGKNKELKREVGVLGLSSNIINLMIGAGIFVLPAIVAEGLGNASITAYMFCGILITLIMLCFAEIGSQITSPGGPYAYIETVFGKYFGFVTAMLFLTGAVAADAAVANALVGVLGTILPIFSLGWVKILFFVFLFTSLAYINIIGVKQGLGLVKFITIAKLIPLLLLVLISWSHISIDNLVWESTPTIIEVGEVSLILFFAFLGAETGLTISGEVKNPKRNIPRAIFISISVVMLLYVLIQTVSQGILGSSFANYKDSPLSEVASRIIGPIGFTLMTIGAAVSMFGNLSSEIFSLPRVVYGAARDNVFPSRFLSKISSKYATPANAIILYSAVGLFFSSIGGFKQMAVIASASVLIIYLGVILAVIKLRTLKNADPGSFKIPGGYAVPILAILIIFWFLSHLSMNEKLGFLLYAVLLSAIYLIILFIKKKKVMKHQ